jgi:hypothetical protein
MKNENKKSSVREGGKTTVRKDRSGPLIVLAGVVVIGALIAILKQ